MEGDKINSIYISVLASITFNKTEKKDTAKLWQNDIYINRNNQNFKSEMMTICETFH